MFLQECDNKAVAGAFFRKSVNLKEIAENVTRPDESGLE